MIKKIIIAIAFLLFFLAGIFLTTKYYEWQEVKVKEESQVLLEKIKKVYQVVTVEGHFSEVYDYQDYWGYDYSPFRKKALVRVKAKVLAGYDLSTFEITALPDEKKIILSQLPAPKIISIEHDLDYYDLTEGTFNAFTAADYNTINTKAKAYILDKATESGLLKSAEEQGNQTIEMIQFMVENAGWTIEYKNKKGLLDTAKVDALLENGE